MIDNETNDLVTRNSSRSQRSVDLTRISSISVSFDDAKRKESEKNSEWQEIYKFGDDLSLLGWRLEVSRPDRLGFVKK